MHIANNPLPPRYTPVRGFKSYKAFNFKFLDNRDHTHWRYWWYTLAVLVVLASVLLYLIILTLKVKIENIFSTCGEDNLYKHQNGIHFCSVLGPIKLFDRNAKYWENIPDIIRAHLFIR